MVQDGAADPNTAYAKQINYLTDENAQLQRDVDEMKARLKALAGQERVPACIHCAALTQGARTVTGWTRASTLALVSTSARSHHRGSAIGTHRHLRTRYASQRALELTERAELGRHRSAESAVHRG